MALRLDPFSASEARVFLPGLVPQAFVEAYAACGGYPLHLLAWNGARSRTQNLRELGGMSGGLLVEEAAGIVREELPDSGGYARILAAVGRGRTRASEIAAEADQRIEHPMDVLVRAGFVRRGIPVGAPRRARPLYEIADTYLAFWFGVLYSDLDQIEAGQGHAVLARRAPQWQRHLGWVFEEMARDHARRLVSAGALPAEMTVGRWWTSHGPACEVDVLGLEGGRTTLLGEAKWRASPLGMRELHALSAKLAHVPRPAAKPTLALWGRGGVDPDVRATGALGYDLAAMLGEDGGGA